MHRKLKRTILVTLDVFLAVYLVMAITSFNHPEETHSVCTKVTINVEDESTNGFLSAKEVKRILERSRLYPFKKKMADVNPRDIEDKLKDTPFVNTAQCYKTKDGNVFISITQRLPIVRVKNVSGDDYYLDEEGGIMPNSKYTSDLIIATGYVSRWYARNYLAYLANELMKDDFWKTRLCRLTSCPTWALNLCPA